MSAAASFDSLPVVVVSLLGVTAVLYLVMLRGARLPRTPWYAGETIVGDVLCPTLVASLAFGVAKLVQLAYRLAAGVVPGAGEIAAALGLAAAFAVAVALVARTVPRAVAPAQVVSLPARAQPARPEQPEVPRAA